MDINWWVVGISALVSGITSWFTTKYMLSKVKTHTIITNGTITGRFTPKNPPLTFIGTELEPVVFYPGQSDFKMMYMNHVHGTDGKCLKNRYTPNCPLIKD